MDHILFPEPKLSHYLVLIILCLYIDLPSLTKLITGYQAFYYSEAFSLIGMLFVSFFIELPNLITYKAGVSSLSRVKDITLLSNTLKIILD